MREERRSVASAAPLSVSPKLSRLMRSYLESRKRAQALLAEDKRDSENAGFMSTDEAGLPIKMPGHHYTPSAVIDAVSAWKKSAIALSELLIELGGLS